MVFISFPNSTTSEEENLLKKYEKLEKKRKSLEKAQKPVPEVVTTTNDKPLEAKDARKLIEKLKKTGQLSKIVINNGRKSEFKRKIPQNPAGVSAIKQPKAVEEEREAICYEDDIFS